MPVRIRQEEDRHRSCFQGECRGLRIEGESAGLQLLVGTHQILHGQGEMSSFHKPRCNRIRFVREVEVFDQIDQDAGCAVGDDSGGLAASIVQIVGLLDILGAQLVLLDPLQAQNPAVELKAALGVAHRDGDVI